MASSVVVVDAVSWADILSLVSIVVCGSVSVLPDGLEVSIVTPVSLSIDMKVKGDEDEIVPENNRSSPFAEVLISRKLPVVSCDVEALLLRVDKGHVWSELCSSVVLRTSCSNSELISVCVVVDVTYRSSETQCVSLFLSRKHSPSGYSSPSNLASNVSSSVSGGWVMYLFFTQTQSPLGWMDISTPRKNWNVEVIIHFLSDYNIRTF